MHIRNSIKFLVVALTAMTFINAGSVSAQPPGTPAQTMSVPPNPQAWCEEGGYCDNGGTPPVAQTPPPRVERRQQPPRPRACIWGTIVGGRNVRTLEAATMTVAGRTMSPGQGLPATVDVGIGGNCVCGDGEYFLPADADHTPINGVRSLDGVGRLAGDGHEICLPRVGRVIENAPPVGVDLRPIITWLTTLEGSVCRVHATNLCQNMVYELNACESRARMNRDEVGFNSCFEQHSYNGSVTIAASDATTGELESCGGLSFECSALGVNYAPVPALPADEVGEGGSSVGEFLSENVDFQVDVNVGAGQSGLESVLVGGEIGGQINLRPFSSNRVGFVLRGSFGGGRIGDEDLAIQDYVPVDRFTRGSASLGLQIALVPRLRLDILAGFVRYTTGNSAENGSGDGARGNGLRTELALTVDLTRSREGFRATPYFRIGLDVQYVTWDIFTTSGGHNYVNRTGAAAMIGFGLRLGSGAILAH